MKRQKKRKAAKHQWKKVKLRTKIVESGILAVSNAQVIYYRMQIECSLRLVDIKAWLIGI